MKNRSNRLIKYITILGLSAILPFSLTGCTPKTAVYSQNGMYFDTIISLTVYDPDHVELMNDCFEMAEGYEQMLSRTMADSDVSRINNAAGNYVEVQQETIELLKKGLYYAELSHGAFDITIGQLSDTWDFGNNTGVVPEDALIQQALSTVGYENISIDGNRVALTNPNTMLDLGAIAKGYIADQMKTYLVEQGVTSAIINLGGNMLLIGSNPDGSKFRIGMQKPFAETGTAMAGLELADCSFVCSGTSERFFEVDGQRYHHLLDTETGYPIQNGLAQVAIISESSVDGDALSTAIFAMGLEDGMDLIEKLEHTEAIFVTNDLEIIPSTGIGKEISFWLLEEELD